jgi:hypothetical protein
MGAVPGRSTQSLAGISMQQGPIKSLRSTETHERCVILCATFREGVSPEQGYRMRDTLNEFDTDGWWFMNPHTFVVAFRSANSGLPRALACYAGLERLSKSVASLAEMGLGGAEGEVLCNLAVEGHLETPPLGAVVNEAFRRSKNAS